MLSGLWARQAKYEPPLLLRLFYDGYGLNLACRPVCHLSQLLGAVAQRHERLQVLSRVTEVELTTDGDSKRLRGLGEHAGRHGLGQVYPGGAGFEPERLPLSPKYRIIIPLLLFRSSKGTIIF